MLFRSEERVRQDLAEQYERMYQDKLKDAMRDPWDRLHTMLKHMVDRLTDEGDERKVFRDSLLTNPIELCDLLTRLNVTKDPQLEEARRMLEKAVRSHDVKDLRDSAGARVELRSDVQTILDKFSWE